MTVQALVDGLLKVSVIISTRNCPRLGLPAIRTALDQGVEVQVIRGDDVPTDETPDVLATLRKWAIRFAVLRDE